MSKRGVGEVASEMVTTSIRDIGHCEGHRTIKGMNFYFQFNLSKLAFTMSKLNK